MKSILASAAAVAALSLFAAGAAPAAPPQPLPAPKVDEPAGPAGKTETAVLSGGCFWGVQAVFQHVKGVKKVFSGYAGGPANAAHYEMVSTGRTGHAESVQIIFDPHQVSYGEILRIFFSVATDPTQVNMQYPDEGPQYRGEIWTSGPEQALVAKAYIKQLDEAHVFKKPIVTRVDPLNGFYQAEGYHQDYLVHHPDQPYIAIYDIPKVAALREAFPDRYVAKPALVFPG